MNDPRESAEELVEVVEDLRRHLLWQEEAGGRALLVDAAKQAAERSASLRAIITPRGAKPPTAPERSAAQEPVTPIVPAESPPLAGPDRAPGPEAPPREAAADRTPSSEPAARASSAPPSAAASRGMLFDVPQQAPPYPGPLPGVVDGERPTLDQIRRELGDCQRCKLCTGRKNIVFGAGNPRAELVFVGEGPGEQEDLQGVPFVGAAGELLTKMIGAMGFTRDDVYICNVVKCRPPGNRNPEPDEITACEPFLRSQLLALQPKVIVALGKFAAQTLLRDSTPITRLRGQWREYQGVKLMPTFHPAYLLRSPNEKRKAWEDLQQVMKIFGKQPGSRT